VGLQLDRGLYAALVVEDPDEPGRYDREAVVVLDDWTDGLGPTPQAILASLQRSGGMSMDDMMRSMTGAAAGGPLGGSGGEVNYPRYLLNGRPPEDPATLSARPGQRLRLRLINAAADTAFRVALGGHRLQVTHSDGYPLDPVTVDALVLAMGERYDLLVDLQEGVYPLVAVAEGKRGQARGLLRTGRGTPPPARARPTELDGRLLDPARLRADPAVALGSRPPDRTHRLTLSGGMGGIPLDDQRAHLRPRPPAAAARRRAHPPDLREPVDDVSPHAPARPHLRHPAPHRQRPTQGHRDRRSHAAAGGGPGRRQPRPLGGALPQPLPHGGGHDDQPRYLA
jgi:FtsP/CotA-like multicopper oxidase with cupredoxin domain